MEEFDKRTAWYTYDNLGRLKTETVTGSIQDGKNGNVTYGYDNVGNRLTRTSSVTGIANQLFGYDANDRLNGDQYDNNGNTRNAPVSQPAAVNPQQLLGTDNYDSENRLTQRVGTTGSNVTLVYDGDSNRIQQSINGQTTTYLVDDRNPTGYARVVVEELVNGVVNHIYTYGHDLISQDRVDSVTKTWHASFYAYDGHGNGRFLTNESGQVTDTYVFDAFGTLITATGTTNNRYLYTGEQFDPALGLYYLRARLMNPLTGRFWSADTYEGSGSDPESLHKYLYTAGDSVKSVDPGGHESLSEVNVSSGIQTSLRSLSAQSVRFAYARAFNVATRVAFSRSFQAAVWAAATAYEAYHLTGDPETAFLAGALGYVFSGGPVLPRSWTPGALRTQVVADIRSSIDTRGIRTLDPEAVVGIRGSTATGVRFKTGGPWNPNDFDIDAFVVSDKIAATFPKNVWFRDARFSGSNFGGELQRLAEEAQSQFLQSQSISPGLRLDRPFTFRVFTSAEWASQQSAGEQQIILP